MFSWLSRCITKISLSNRSSTLGLAIFAVIRTFTATVVPVASTALNARPYVPFPSWRWNVYCPKPSRPCSSTDFLAGGIAEKAAGGFGLRCWRLAASACAEW